MNTELLIRLLFLVLVLSILFTIESTNLKTSYSQFSDQTYINLTNIFDFIGLFSKYVGFDEIKWLCGFTKYITHKFTTMPQSTPMSWHKLHSVHCKKLNVKNLWKCILGLLGEWVSFSYFPNTVLDQDLIQVLCNI